MLHTKQDEAHAGSASNAGQKAVAFHAEIRHRDGLVRRTCWAAIFIVLETKTVWAWVTVRGLSFPGGWLLG